MLNRRHLLKGFSLGASSVLLSPIARQLEAYATGSTQMPKRFVFVLEGNGLNWQQIQPKGIERNVVAKGNSADDIRQDQLVDQPLDGHALPKALEPLQPFKNRLTILQGLSGRICGGGHSNDLGALGAFPGNKGAYAETIDCALANALPSVFRRIGLGMVDKPGVGVVYNTSAWGRGKKAPTQCRPDLAYNALFGSVAEGRAKRDFQAKSNLLDFMIEDVRRFEKRLAGPEREKLGSYLGAFESMRDRQSRLNEIQDTLRKHAPAPDDKYTSDIETDRLDAQFDIGAAALVAGLTNVLTIASGSGNPYFGVKFNGLGIEMGKHSIGHGKSYQGKSWDELAIIIRRFHMDLIARLASKLDAVPEGDGTMLDNTLIIYLSDAAEKHHSRCWEWPFVMLGNLGGRLKTAGRYLEYPCYGHQQHRTINNFYTTLLHAAGAPRETFGVSDPGLSDLDQTGPLQELLA